MKRWIVALLLAVGFPGAMAWAGCKSDCRDEYESEIDSCKMLHDDPDDAELLKLCIDNAKDEFEECIKECDN